MSFKIDNRLQLASQACCQRGCKHTTDSPPSDCGKSMMTLRGIRKGGSIGAMSITSRIVYIPSEYTAALHASPTHVGLTHKCRHHSSPHLSSGRQAHYRTPNCDS